MNCKRIFSWLLMLLPILSFGQEQLGLRYDNYSGINSVVLNPANNITSKFSWDINLVEVGVFIDQSYGYLANTNLLEIVTNSDNITSAVDLDNPNDPNAIYFDFYDLNRPSFVSTNIEVMGPSFMINLSAGHTFGIFTRVRAMVGGKKIPASLGYYNIENVLEGEDFNIPRFKLTGMAWSEIGLNYAREFYGNAGKWGLGANIRILNGYEAFYTHNRTDFQLARFPNDSIVVSNLDLAFGFTTASVEQEALSTKANGTGFGMDLGAVFTQEDSEDDYRFKFGVSILDIGKIGFARNSESHGISYLGSTGFNINEFNVVTDVDQGTELLSELLLGNLEQSKNPGGFGIWLPMAFSAQVDYKVVDMVYVNASLVQGIPLPGPALSRDNIFSISPRLEHRWFGISFPVSLYNWQDFRFGTSMRLGFLTFGTDKLNSFIGQSDFTGSDFYLALKVNPFQIKLGGIRGNDGKNVRCYEF